METFSEGSSSSAGVFMFERRHLYKWMESTGLHIFKNRIEAVKNELAERYNVEDEFASFAHQLKERWDSCRSKKKSFERKNRDWLNGTIELRYIRAGRSHQQDCKPEVIKKPIISAEEEFVPVDAVYDSDFESVSGEAGEVCRDIDENVNVTVEERATVVEFTCDQCEYRCRLEYELEVHKASQHIMSELYHCCKCKYFCRDRKDMVRHQAIHLSLTRYQCGTCNHQDMRGQSNPARSESYLCDRCGFCCMREDMFKLHQSSHSGDSLHNSDISDNSQRIDPDDLHKHQKSRMSEMLYACERCEYSSRDDLVFGRHQMSHAKEKSNSRMIYACNLCDFRCQYSDSLKSHIITHLSEEASFSEEDSASSLDLG